MKTNRLEISKRLEEFGQSRFGAERGWKSRFAEALSLTSGSLQLYLTGERIPGIEMHQRLRDLGCDIEWLMTGKESTQARGDPSGDELIAMLKEAGITSPRQLRELLEQHEQLRRSLGPAAYQTVLEIARVAEHRGKYGGRKRRKKLGGS